MYSVSVIMPIYNNEKMLKNTIDSILNQTIYGFELILVNDGSTDASGQICDEYARKEPLLIEVIHQRRQGLAVALNKGLFNSTGEYVYFADPTDTFEPRMLQSNVKLAREKNADLVVFGFTSKDNNGTGELIQHLPSMPLLSEENDFRNHYRNFHHFHPQVLFNKLYKRTYLFEHRLRFHNLPIMEDAFFNLKAYKEISTVAFNRKAHCHRNHSERLKNHAYEEHFYTIYLEYIKSLNTVFTFWGKDEEFTDLIIEEHYKALTAEIKNMIYSERPLSIEEQSKRINELLDDKEVLEKLQQVTPSINVEVDNRLLLSYFQNGKGAEAVKLLNRRNGTKIASNRVTKFVRSLFKPFN